MSTKSRLLRLIHGGAESTWGHDPAEYDPSAVEKSLSSVSRLFGPGRYFPLDVRGWERVPDAPTMVVGNHSGGTSFPDLWGLVYAWYRHFGTTRPLHPLAHEMVFSTRLTGPYFARRGVLQATRGIASRVLGEHRRDLLVLPGGDLDTWRPFSERYKVRFAGRTGYARTALENRVPIVPFAHAGAHHTLYVLTDGQRLASALRLPELARARIFPVHLSLPWGLGIGPLPHIPIPITLRYRIGEPIHPPAEIAFDTPITDAMVLEHDARVRAAVQALLDQLSRGE